MVMLTITRLMVLGGFYDIVFSFDQSGSSLFNDNKTSTYTFTAPGLTIEDFNTLSAPEQKDGSDSYLTAAHVQGIGTDGASSGSLVEDSDCRPHPQRGFAPWLRYTGACGNHRRNSNKES